MSKLIILTMYEDNQFIQYFYNDFNLSRIIAFEELKTQKGKYKIILDVDKYKNFQVLNDKFEWVKIEEPNEIKEQIENFKKITKINELYV